MKWSVLLLTFSLCVHAQQWEGGGDDDVVGTNDSGVGGGANSFHQGGRGQNTHTVREILNIVKSNSGAKSIQINPGMKAGGAIKLQVKDSEIYVVPQNGVIGSVLNSQASEVDETAPQLGRFPASVEEEIEGPVRMRGGYSHHLLTPEMAEGPLRQEWVDEISRVLDGSGMTYSEETEWIKNYLEQKRLEDRLNSSGGGASSGIPAISEKAGPVEVMAHGQYGTSYQSEARQKELEEVMSGKAMFQQEQVLDLEERAYRGQDYKQQSLTAVMMGKKSYNTHKKETVPGYIPGTFEEAKNDDHKFLKQNHSNATFDYKGDKTSPIRSVASLENMDQLQKVNAEKNQKEGKKSDETKGEEPNPYGIKEIEATSAKQAERIRRRQRRKTINSGGPGESSDKKLAGGKKRSNPYSPSRNMREPGFSIHQSDEKTTRIAY